MAANRNIRRIVCFGSGGMAWSLLPALQRAGCHTAQVFSPTAANASTLAMFVGAQTIDCAQCYDRSADLAILAVPDDAVADMLPLFRNEKIMVAHTAGSLSMHVFENQGITNYGVIYPLQTFSRGSAINMAGVPIFVEANNDANAALLLDLAHAISGNAQYMSSQRRMGLHLAAVFACNYVNHCMAIAADIMQENGIPLSVIHPLVRQTIDKALAAANPRCVQTGPAMRGDITTMQKHLELLKNNPARQQLYRLMAQSIAAGMSNGSN
jgi:predicted short-subunit dehydrogenase-like oxidoreductase (DUF2520 family)